MIKNRPAHNKKFRNILTGGMAAVVCAGIFSAFFIAKEADENLALNYKGGIEGTVSATLQTSDATIELAGENAHFSFAPMEKLSLPYTLSSSLFSGVQARDFVFSVPDAGKIDIVVDGFSADDKVTLTLNGDEAFKDMPLDWSGRIALTSGWDGKDGVKACVEISGRDITVCHQVPKGAGA